MTDGIIGRAVTFTWGGATVLGIREKDITLNGAAIDVTSGENSGVQTLLTASGQDSLEIKISGVTKDTILRTDWFAGNRTKQTGLSYPDGSSISGLFYLSTYDEKGSYKDAVTFDGTLMSTGPFVYTPGV